MADESGEKTEQPTQKKIDDARKKGQVWKSRDFSGVLVFLVGFSVVKATWPTVREKVTDLFNFGFDKLAHPKDLETAIYELLLMATTTTVMLTVPIVAGAGIVGGLSEFLQVGPLLALESLQPKLEKLNPLQGIKNLVSKKQLVELLKNLLKLTITGYVVYGAVRDSMGMIVAAVNGTPEQMLDLLGELVYRVAMRVGLCLMLFGMFDIWFQRRSYMKDMMMTKEEVKKEYKESEGDPHHKAKRKELHMEILEGAQMEAVKSADVIVTNPDHVAVAIKYDREKDGAPRVIARGIDARAEKIKALAKASDVAMMRNVPLAHALLRVEVGEEIPEALYDAVAEVLNFVYQLKAPNAA
ncbi:MAG: type III secretion system export apparatus subunit SctU [Myxococcaceae bacterium]